MTNEEAMVFMDNLIICIKEHPVLADWLVEIANRKDEPQSDYPCNTCANKGDHNGECSNCVADSEPIRWKTPSHYKPKTKCDTCETYWNCQGQCDEMPQIEDEPQIKCPKCGRSDYIRSFEDWGIDGGIYKYKCINCNTYIKDEPQIEESQFTKQCHKPSSSYYRCYCDERKEDEYCNGCRFWYEPQKVIKDLQEYYGIKPEPMLSDEEWKKDGK